MAYVTVVSGTHVFTKNLGYCGAPQLCPNCGKTYKRSLIKHSLWWHLYYIPLIPLKPKYTYACPICGAGESLTGKEGKTVKQLPVDPTPQNLVIYAKHYPANKEKGFLKTDTAYELWVDDTVSGEKIQLSSQGDTTKDTIKTVRKNRGLKKIEIIESTDQALIG